VLFCACSLVIILLAVFLFVTLCISLLSAPGLNLCTNLLWEVHSILLEPVTWVNLLHVLIPHCEVEVWPRREAKATHICDMLTNLHLDRKSTRLNSSHVSISYAVFCLKKKK